MYSGGASEKRLGELAEGKDVLIATKFPAGFFTRANGMPRALEDSLTRLRRKTIDLYQHHFPTGSIAIPGAKNSRQAAANAEALTFALEPSEVEALSHATTARRSSK